MIELLQEILDAGKDAKLPLDMLQWHCGTACCLCGDVAIMRGSDNPSYDAQDFSGDLDEALEEIFDTVRVGNSIYGYSSCDRKQSAKASQIFTTEELNHPHLNRDHNDRSIAHDFVRLVMRKCEEKMQEKATCTH